MDALKSPTIEPNPAVMVGKSVVVGTRITVELVLEKLAARGDIRGFT